MSVPGIESGIVIAIEEGLYDPVIGQVVSVRGPQGFKGDKGDKGDTGDPSLAFLYTQPTPSLSWVIVHNLGYKPLISVFSPGGLIVECSPLHDNDNQITIVFNIPFAGSARLI